MEGTSKKPSWDRLYALSAAQDGYFTTAQAAESGYSPQLLVRYLANGRFQRIRRGIYRIVHYPAGEHENLAVFWLWSERAGVFSHETALALYDLSDVLPTRLHLTLPGSWRGRRLRVPEGLVLYHADLPDRARQWAGSVPVTSPAQTLIDCAEADLSPELLLQALREGLGRGLFARDEVAPVERHLSRFEQAAR